jgi:hypothetical protein
MIAFWIHIFKLQLTIGLTHIGLDIITQGFVSPCHISITSDDINLDESRKVR